MRIDGQAKSGELGEAGRPGAGDGEIGRAVHFFHAVMKRRDVRGNFLAQIIVGHEPFIARAGQMDYLERLALQAGAL